MGGRRPGERAQALGEGLSPQTSVTKHQAGGSCKQQVFTVSSSGGRSLRSEASMVREGLVFVFVLCPHGSRRVWGLSGDSLIRALIPFLRVPPHDLVTSQTPPPPNTLSLGGRISTYVGDQGRGANGPGWGSRLPLWRRAPPPRALSQTSSGMWLGQEEGVT